MRPLQVAVAVAIVAASIVWAGMTASPGSGCELCPPSGSPEVSGQITRIFDYPPPGVQDMILVKRRPDECGMELPAHESRIVVQTENGYRVGDLSELQVGRRVRAWLSMGVLTKCPGMSMASVIAVD